MALPRGKPGTALDFALATRLRWLLTFLANFKFRWSAGTELIQSMRKEPLPRPRNAKGSRSDRLEITGRHARTGQPEPCKRPPAAATRIMIGF